MTKKVLTKDIIFQYTTQEAIYIKLLNLDDFPKGNISSPFSDDKKPSFKVWKNGSFKCNSTGKQGDVFQFVAELRNLDCKSQFNEVLNIVASEMNLFIKTETVAKTFAKKGQTFAKPLQKPLQHLFYKGEAVMLDTVIDKETVETALQQPLQQLLQQTEKNVAKEKTPSLLTVSTREFTILDLEYWNTLGVEKATLKKYELHSISSYTWTGKKPIYTKKESVAFAIALHGNFKLYIPNQIEIGVNKNVLPPFPTGVFGIEQLGVEKKENLIICAGEKDVIVATSRGFHAVTFGSEAIHPKDEQIQKLQSLCNNLFICYDNDKTGENGRNAIVKRFSKIIPLLLPEKEAVKGYDITDYFQEHNSEDFQKIISLAVKNKNTVTVQNVENKGLTTIFHIAEDYLLENYDFRNNMISLEIEISHKDENKWTSCNENSLWLEIQKKSIKIPLNSLIAILKSDFVPNYNPLINYFTNLPEWNKETDYIKQFSEYVKLEQGENKEQFEYHFKKWCVRAVKCATIDDYFNKQAFVLTDDGNGQNIGKSSWCRFLCPSELSNYMAEDMSDDKDARILLCKNFLINLDELAALSRKEINQLKSYFSKAQINERLPYDRKNSIIQRVSSFMGSTNMTTFLQDETGSVRWLCFIVKSIDWNYKKEFDINNLWTQAYALSKDKSYDEALSIDDIKQNETRNEKFQVISPERDLIHKHFEIPVKLEFGEFLTATEILHHISLYTSGVRLSNIGIGKALKSIGFKRDKHNQVYGYWMKKKTF
ncbi:VapE domain-containing protein [Flavobacterium praedii]|uniref:VapE domain-containing protein n=1 Tax=Flavobacterium praedii TaxID=3002900 RepID=UPI002481F968|nr:VapE domain-containing protein [Flavobacterium praedii]